MRIKTTEGKRVLNMFALAVEKYDYFLLILPKNKALMQIENLPNHYVYKPETIEFITVVAEVCLFLENTGEMEKDEFIDKAIKILPLLYLKCNLLPTTDYEGDGYVEQFVGEDDYDFVCERIKNLLGEEDAFLEVFHPDIQFSDTPIAAFISENLADIYQELKDLAANYQIGETSIMNDAIINCMESFKEHWGQKTLNALRALHHVKYQSGSIE